MVFCRAGLKNCELTGYIYIYALYGTYRVLLGHTEDTEGYCSQYFIGGFGVGVLLQARVAASFCAVEGCLATSKKDRRL